MSVDNGRECYLLVDDYRVFVTDDAGTQDLNCAPTHRIDREVVEVVPPPSRRQFPPVSEVMVDLAERLDRAAWGEGEE